MSKKSRKKTSGNKGVSWKWWLLALAGWLLLMILEGRPQLQPIRDSLAYRLMTKLILSGVILYFTFCWREKQTLPAKVILCISALLPFQTLLIQSDRFLLITILLIPLVGTAYLLYQHITTKRHSQVLFYVTMTLYLFGIMSSRDYTFVNNADGFHFWRVSLLAAVLLGAGGIYLVANGILTLKDNRISEKVCLCLLTFFMGFVLTWATAMNLNYALDTSEPKVYSLEIIEKDISSSRSGTDYYLYVELHGEKRRLTVSQSDYHSCDIGDDHYVYLYSGAFNDPYYIAR